MPSLNSASCTAETAALMECATGEHAPSEKRLTGKAYWRSLDELADTPQFRQFLHDEFPAGATELLDSSQRRHFLKVMGASLALAGVGLAGCRRRPEEKIAPFARRPEDRVPGVPDHFATAMELGGVSSGLLVTSFDGRPIKIEGNPEHPINQGATTAIMQASVLDLYDPDRSQHVFHGAEQSTWEAFAQWSKTHFEELRKSRGQGLAILSEASTSPSLLDMKARLLSAFPGAAWHEYEPINNDNEMTGSVLAFGTPHRAHLSLDRAAVIVSLDSDFLLNHPASVKHARDFARGRRMSDSSGQMSRLYSFEGTLSLTGANADHRFAVRSTDVAVIAALLAAAILDNLSSSAAAALGQFAKAVPAGWSVAEVERVITTVANDLREHRGRCVVVAGERQPAAVHLLAHLINTRLDAVGKTVAYTPLANAPQHGRSIKALADAIAKRSVTTLVIIGGNPAYDAPIDLDFAELLRQVNATIHLSSHRDETSTLCTWHLPRAHYLETWGDGRGYDGTISIAQPLIEPLFGGRSPIELLALLTGDALSSGYDIVRRTFGQITGSSDLDFAEVKKAERTAPATESQWSPLPLWRKTLHDGLLAGSAWTTATPAADRGKLTEHLTALWESWSGAGSEGFELVFAPDNRIYDGRFANNGWLQELPDPLTKITWDNAVLISPAAAQTLGVNTGDMVRIITGAGQRGIDAAVCVMPGQHERCATIALGYGRRFNGQVAADAGFDAYQLRTSAAMGFATGVRLEKSTGTYVLAMTQDHHSIDANSTGGKGVQERLPTLFREADLEEYRHEPTFVKHRTHVVHRLSLWDDQQMYAGAEHKWAMAIDLNSCIGCGACITACQAENNIPVVGKDQVRRGREMHWIRVDRYFKFAGDAASGYDVNKVQSIALQPVTCHHCETAPCEQVCPVAATVHDHDGLNVMVYNRCIGTRYCSNNCPYKVRRFNYFDYQVRKPVRDGHGLLHVETEYYTEPQSNTHPLKKLQHNPEVTVRSRGVMEKCTYCVQRLSAAKIKAKNAWVKLPEQDKLKSKHLTIADTDVVTACAQACPAQAITFGDLTNPGSAVVRDHSSERAYSMLEELNTKPRTRYLAKIRNPIQGMHPA